MTAFDRLRQVGLFVDLPDEDLERICRSAEEVRLDAGTTLFSEGDQGDAAYVITAGEVDVLKAAGGRDVRLAVRVTGDVIGEMSLLYEEPRNATLRTRTDVELLSISKTALDEVLDSSPSAARAIFQTLLLRIRENNDLVRHSERMAQLGTLTAGVAHELNNPASAVARAAERLTEELAKRWSVFDEGAPPGRRAVMELLQRADDPGPSRSPLERSDAESELEDWLDDHGISSGWELAPKLVDAGLDVAALEKLADAAPPAELDDAVQFLASSAWMRRLTTEIAVGARRLSDIVRALKGYSYLDQAPVQDVDVVAGLEDTLLLLGHKLKEITVVREYQEVPMITARGSELNQVWTNLVDNACDALEGRPDAQITLRVQPGADSVVVEVEDNGPGIPDEMRDQVFDAFFTTKPPGKGTGLGLQISYRIITLEHGGDLTVDSEQGRTTFRAELPLRPPVDPGTLSADHDPGESE